LQAAVLRRGGEAIEHAYGATGGSIAIIQETEGYAALEVSMSGCKGMVGAHLALGSREAPQRTVVQTAGWALRINHERLHKELASNSALKSMVHRFLYFQLNQQAGRISCMHYHQIAPRLATWLLECQDSTNDTIFPVTHALIASMLGVRRVSITNAAGKMQDKGLIRYHRGKIEILEREGLEAAACVCYQKETIAYQRLFG